jgi:hypothetical protein
MLIGIDTITATVKIIEEFEPKYWVIENPLTSSTWFYQHKFLNFSRGYENKTFYSSYDKSFSAKPTIFKSNIHLNLIEKKHHGNSEHMAKGNYEKRSSIPNLLTKNIIDSILSHMKVVLC